MRSILIAFIISFLGTSTLYAQELQIEDVNYQNSYDLVLEGGKLDSAALEIVLEHIGNLSSFDEDDLRVSARIADQLWREHKKYKRANNFLAGIVNQIESRQSLAESEGGGILYLNYANTFMAQKKFIEADSLLTTAVAILEKHTNLDQLVKATLNQGLAKARLGDYELGLRILNGGYNRLEDKSVKTSTRFAYYRNLGIFNRELHRIKAAIEYTLLSLPLAARTGDSLSIYSGLSGYYSSISYDTSLYFAELGLSHARISDYPYQHYRLLTRLSTVYAYSDKYRNHSLAQGYLDKAFKVADAGNYQIYPEERSQKKGNLDFARGDYKSSRALYGQAFQQLVDAGVKDLDYQNTLLLRYLRSSFLVRNDTAANNKLTLYIENDKTTREQAIKGQLEKFEVELDLAEKSRKIQELKDQEEINRLKIRTRNILVGALILGLIGIGFLAYWWRRVSVLEKENGDLLAKKSKKLAAEKKELEVLNGNLQKRVRALALASTPEAHIVVKRDTKEFPIFLSEIMYLSTKKPGAEYQLTNERRRMTTETYRSAHEELPESFFFQTKRGYTINLNFVEYVNKKHVLMKNGEKVPLTKVNRRLLRDRLSRD